MKMRAMLTSSLREIRQSKARFFSILGIIFLGVAFFVGLRGTGPDMMKTADNYYRDYQLADNQIISSLGLAEEDLKIVKENKNVLEAEGLYSADISLTEINNVIRVFSYQPEQKINQYVLVEGRLPKKSGEIALDGRLHSLGAYKLGETFKIPEADDVYDNLKLPEYKVVGFVNNPTYVEKVSRGNTNVGSGLINYFGVVSEADFNQEVFSSILVRYKDLADLTAYSDTYEERLAKDQKQIETLLKKRPEDRLKEAKDEAQVEIDQAKQDIVDGEKAIADGEAEIAKSRKELDDAQAELTKGQNELATKKKDGQAEITANENKLANSEKEIVAKEAELATKDQELATQKQELATKATEVEAAKAKLAELQTQQEQASASVAPYQASKDSVLSAKNNINWIADDLFESVADDWAMRVIGIFQQMPPGITWSHANFINNPTKRNIISSIDAVVGQLDGAMAQANNTVATIDSSIAEINGQVQQYDGAAAQITTAENELAAARQQIAAGRQQIEDGRQEIAAAKTQLNQAVADGEATLAKSKTELADGEKKYEEAVAEFDKEKAEQEPKLKNAKKQIDTQEDVLAETKAQAYVFNSRDDNPGYLEYEDNAGRISSLATIFPIIFFLIAALVSLTTMTRMVEEKRLEIGTFKALGYKNLAISMKFLLYSFLAGTIGAILGLAVGYYLFPTIIFGAYGNLYNLTEFVTPWYLEYSLVAIAVALLCTVGTAVIVLRFDLFSTPATLMRPKAPKSGKRILLERIKPIWKHLSFNQKVTMRNLFRYKQRMLMTVLGIAGCMSMIITGFGLKDSISDIVNIQFNKIWHYQGIVTFNSKKDEAEREKYYQQLSEVGQYENHISISSSTLDLVHDDGKFQVTVYVPNTKETDDFLLFNDRKTGETYHLEDDGVFINEKIARKFDLKVKDTITLKNSDGESYQVKISEIIENYTGNYAFMTPKYYKEVFGKDAVFNTDFLLFKKDLTSKQEHKIAEQLMENKQVINVSFLSQSKNALDDTIDSLNIVVWVLIISAGLLAFIVLYNLTNINVSERIRELSTIKVLGFYNNELTMYIYRENILLTLLGILLGLVIGKIEHRYVLETVEVDMVMFPPTIHIPSYVYASLITIFFAFVVGMIMHNKLKHVDMIEALKSNE
ncbi:putative ABC transport system permease protein [Enterococcus sp. PF1-24]|uniref:FtsX-like permease family protein n=1 Tax=unclassified Enterococcus TaxID=2608891 RepID=UPI0024744E60|nr:MULTISPECIES: FtsX-like permease family protein [unclassified Enterococcus]MDH6365097.1 putative ABC transport system permease protein [Enterococcus sp. PFB1-1]MDH6402198.1 putative ABC transport system permease protein [Enterococcus sp. PF1-24]